MLSDQSTLRLERQRYRPGFGVVNQRISAVETPRALWVIYLKCLFFTRRISHDRSVSNGFAPGWDLDDAAVWGFQEVVRSM